MNPLFPSREPQSHPASWSDPLTFAKNTDPLLLLTTARGCAAAEYTDTLQEARDELRRRRSIPSPVYDQKGAHITVSRAKGRRVVVLGDLHGDAASLCLALRESEFLSRRARNEDVLLVCLGDFINKGPESLETIHILAQLLTHPLSHGRVILLRGNHEQGRQKGVDLPSLRSRLVQEVVTHRLVTSSRYPREHARDLIWESVKGLLNELPLVCQSDHGAFFCHAGYAEVLARAKKKRALEIMREWPPHDDLISDILWCELSATKHFERLGTGNRSLRAPLGPVYSMMRKFDISLLVRGHQYRAPLELDPSRQWEKGWWKVASSPRGNIREKAREIVTVNTSRFTGAPRAAWGEIDFSALRATFKDCRFSSVNDNYLAMSEE